MSGGRATIAPSQAVRQSRLSAYVEMLHLPPIFVVLTAAAAITSIASFPPRAADLALFLAALFVSQLAISLHNDYCDRALDARAKPWRALPRGLITPRQALVLAGLLLTMAVAFAAPLGLEVVLLGVVGTGAGLLYNAVLKRTLLVWAPFWIALPTLAIASLAIADEFTATALLAYVVGLPLAVAAYLTDTVDDAASDRDAGVRSLTAVLGERRAKVLAWVSLALAIAVGALFFGDERSLPVFGAAVVPLGLAIAASRFAPRAHWTLMMAGVVCVGAACAIGLTG